MSNKFVFLDVVKVYDEEIFTRERAADWKQHIKSAYDCIFHGLKDKIDDSTQVRFFACKSLIDEVIIDAIIGMRKNH